MKFKIRSNKSKVLSIFLATILVITQLFLLMPSVQTFALNGKTKIIIHYAKTPSSNLKWNMWLWPDKMEGSKFVFTEKDEFGQVCVVELDGELKKVGFIVRTDQWKKDIEEDRYISQFNNGIGEIWLKESDPKVYYSAAEAKAGATKLPVVLGTEIVKPGEFIVAKIR